MKLIASAIAFAMLVCSSAYAKDQPKPPVFAAVPLVAETLPPEAMAERTIAEKEPFLTQRLTAMKSVTLGADIATKTDAGNVLLVKGARLLMAIGLADKKEFYCSGFDPKTGAAGWPTDSAKVQWVCFIDDDKDGAFETSYSTSRNNGSRLPSFSMLTNPAPITPAAYTADEEANRVFFETAIKYDKTFNIYGRAFFYKIVRLPGDTEWHDIVSSLKGVEGGYTSVKQDQFPQDFDILGTKITLVGKTDAGMTVKPVSTPKGIVSYAVSTYRRY